MRSIRAADLRLLGLPASAAEVYAFLLTSGPATGVCVAASTGVDIESVRDAFVLLNEAGLVSIEPAGAGGVGAAMPVRPGPGLDLLMRRREAELRQVRITAAKAYETLRRSMGGEPISQLVETITGPVVADRIRHLERAVRREIRGFDSPPYYADADANQIELDNLARGVRYRVVYATAALARGDYLADNVIPGVRAGEQARTLPDVPVKLMLFDDECAVVSPSLTPALDATGPDAGNDQSALLIRPCSLLSALNGLFEMCWRAALPFDLNLPARTAAPFLRPVERRLLSLFAAGMGDEQVARTLGFSRRTLFRHLEGLMSRTGAANRFQLALHAARNGWI